MTRGTFKVKTEEEVPETGFDEIEKEEETKRERLEFYLKPENWLHLSPELGINGRTTREEPEFADDVEEETKEALKKQLEKVVVPVKRLQPITADKCKLTRRRPRQVLALPGRRRPVRVPPPRLREARLNHRLPSPVGCVARFPHLLQGRPDL